MELAEDLEMCASRLEMCAKRLGNIQAFYHFYLFYF